MDPSSTAARSLELQKDELEALRSIYGEDFVIEDSVTNTFSIQIHIGEKEGEEATLVISYTPDYPAKSLPVYYLSIPWIRGPEKQKLHETLEELYRESKGESVIVYTWVEKLRELLSAPGMSPPTCSSTADSQPTSETALAHALSQGPIDMESGGRENTCNAPPIKTGEPLTDRKSTFQAHVATVNSVQEVKLVLAELLKNKKIASATHNMYAYRIQSSDKNWIQDCDDDGETHAGGRLLHLLQILDCKNVVVVVTRWYGGVMLYGDRFKHINNVARVVLEQNGFIKVAK